MRLLTLLRTAGRASSAAALGESDTGGEQRRRKDGPGQNHAKTSKTGNKSRGVVAAGRDADAKTEKGICHEQRAILPDAPLSGQ